MIKVKLSKKTLNEIERGSYQEKFTTGGGETKTMLDNIFNGKVRIFFPIDLSYGVIEKTEQINSFIDDNSNALKNQFTNLLAIPVAGEREDVAARKEKIRKDPVRNFLMDQIPFAFKEQPDDAKGSVQKKTQLLIYAYSRLMIDYFSKIINAAKAEGAIVKFDFDKKLIIIQKSGESKASATRLPVFMNLLTQATEIFSSAVINFAESTGSERVTDEDFLEQVSKKVGNDPVILRFAKYFISIDPKGDFDNPVSDLLFSFNDVLAHNKLDLTRIDLFQDATIVKNEMIFKLAEKYLFDFASSGKGKNYVLLTRVPRDVVRMSDFPGLTSCHTPVYPDEDAQDRMYASCATQEASSKGGAVAYLFKNLDLKPEEISKLETSNDEFMSDPRRNIEGIVPISRLRVRTVGIFDDAGKETILHVPDSRMYGKVYESFTNLIHSFLKQNQTNQLAAIANIPGDIKLKIYGGGYTDSSLAVKINSFIGRDAGFIKDREYSTHYEDSIGTGLDKIKAEYDKAFKSVLSDETKQVIDMEYKSEKFFEGDDSPSQGYFSGHPRPEEIDTRTPKIFVNPIAILTSSTIIDILKNNYKSLEGKDLTKNIISPQTNEFKNFCLGFGFKKIGSVFKDTSMLFQSEEVTNNVYTQISNDGQRIDVFTQTLIEDLKNPKKVKEYFNIDVIEKKPEMPLQKVKNIFKRFM